MLKELMNNCIEDNLWLYTPTNCDITAKGIVMTICCISAVMVIDAVYDKWINKKNN